MGIVCEVLTLPACDQMDWMLPLTKSHQKELFDTQLQQKNLEVICERINESSVSTEDDCMANFSNDVRRRNQEQDNSW